MGKSKGTVAARPAGRPRSKVHVERLVAYLRPKELAAVKRAARKAGARSLSSWVAAVLSREASVERRTGRVPQWVIDMPSVPDPNATLRQIVREERDSGW